MDEKQRLYEIGRRLDGPLGQIYRLLYRPHLKGLDDATKQITAALLRDPSSENISTARAAIHGLSLAGASFLGRGLEATVSVVELFLTKLDPTADAQHILRHRPTLQKAIEYYSKYGDFSLLYIPGDGADGFDLTHIGGNVHDSVVVYPPDWRAENQDSLSETQTVLQPDHKLILPVKKTIVVVNEQLANLFRNDPESLHRIDPKKFERLVAELFQEEGYEVILTTDGPDRGKDLYVFKKDSLTETMFVVECKKYSLPYKVDVGIARKLYGVVQHERASGGIIVTTSYFTKPAKEFASTIPYQLFLRDFDYLIQWLKKTK